MSPPSGTKSVLQAAIHEITYIILILCCTTLSLYFFEVKLLLDDIVKYRT